jgi:SMI1 / KNR4 family (SUKH-1)
MAIDFESFGPVDEERLRDAERRLGFELPAAYRRWLRATGGGKPSVPARLSDQNFIWNQLAYGIRPDLASADLADRYGYFSDRLPPAYLPVASVHGGLLAVKVTGDQAGSVWFWDDDEPGRTDDTSVEEEEALLHRCATDWDDLLARLEPATSGLTEEQEDELLRQVRIDF